MKLRLGGFLSCLLFELTSFSQTNDYTRWLTAIPVDGKPLLVLRMPIEEVTQKLKSDIDNIQWKLDRNKKFFVEGNSVEFGLKGQVEMLCLSIAKQDSLFPLQYYREEAKAYLASSEVRQQR